uniref:Oxidoreductase NAD-binding domain-containing protein 1 n=1 Tax=Romanomermis culicivorax TaxID=13658 RepID=A0A915J7J7_ROMCU
MFKKPHRTIVDRLLKFVGDRMSARFSHTERTKNNFRQKEKIAVRVTNTVRLSPTVKLLKFKAEEPDVPIRFKAGQWIDLIMPFESSVGGYSICSAPFESSGTNSFSIAVKYVTDSPAQWCHDATINTQAYVRIGGDFYFEPEQDFSTEHLVFVAGGVGVNPIHSILKQCLYTDNLITHTCRTYRLLYGAQNEAELLFKTDFMEFATMYNSFAPKFYVSREPPYTDNPLVKKSHVTREDIMDAVNEQIASKTKIFICGPPPMIDSVQQILDNASFPKNRIFYEKWW